MKRAQTGCSVLLFDSPAVCSVCVMGGAPGTRETDLLDPARTVEKVHGILLAGGSAFGLAAADGVMRFLAERNIGFAVGKDRVPIVPAAVIYDRGTGKPAAPGSKEGYAACKNAGYRIPAQRNIGAGCGATVGKFSRRFTPDKGGLAVIVERFQKGINMAAVVVVNAYGNVIRPENGAIVAGATDKKGGKVPFKEKYAKGLYRANTTIGAVITDAALTKSDAKRVAIAAHEGLAKTINPSHTMYDGDTLFVASTGKKKADINTLGIRAADIVSKAIIKAVGGV